MERPVNGTVGVAAPPEALGAPASPAHTRFIEVERRLLQHYGVEATSRFIEIASPRLRVHTLEAGRGEPALILHGGDGQGVDWAPLMAPLQEHLHMFAVDRPGFGLSDPFDYRRVDVRAHAAAFVTSTLDALGLESATLLGGSMGGFFALAAALAAPERIRRVILIGAPVGFAAGGGAPLGLRIACGIPGLSTLMMRSLAKPSLEPRKKQYRRMFNVDPSSIPDLYFEMQSAGLMIPGVAQTWAVLMRRIGSLRGIRPEMSMADELPTLRPPTLVLWGERDMAPVDVGRRATERIPRGTFVPMSGVAHFPFLEAPGGCVDHIGRFLEETAG